MDSRNLLTFYLYLYILLYLVAVCPAAANIISVEPLWDASITNNGTQPCSIEDHGTEGGFLLNGRSHQTCSVQVNISTGFRVKVQMIAAKNISEPVLLYITRQGDLVYCPNKYLIFTVNEEMCSANLLHDKLHLNIHGNASIKITVVQESESDSNCPELYGDNSTNHKMTRNCNKVKGYRNQITCDQYNEGNCRIEFPTICNATLGIREVWFHCTHRSNDTVPDHKTMIMYPIDVIFLYLDNNNMISIENGSFNSFNDLQVLHLQNNKLSTLREEVFLGLHMLYELFLYGNTLFELPGGLFRNLKMLTNVYLYDNLLNVLPVSLFQGLENLSKLYLDNNQLTTVDVNTFEGCGKLYVLKLNGNKLTELPIGLFWGLQHLIFIRLNNNLLKMLDYNAFRDLDNLKYLFLNENELVEIPEGLFNGLSRLSQLYLEYNQLPILPVKAFLGLDSLTALYLNGNQLISLRNDVFYKLIKLQWLHLDTNYLITLADYLFSDLENLLYLRLHRNQLSVLNPNTFQGLKALVRLHLYENQLKTLHPEMFFGLSNLEGLYLNQNKLVYLNESIFHEISSKLTHLFLRDNNLTKLPEKLFEGMDKLYILTLYENQITNLDENTFNGLIRMTYINLADNKLVELPAGLFRGLERLNELHIFANQLVTLDSSLFNNLFNLRVLSLGDNKLVALPDNIFHGLANLEYLSLQFNRLKLLNKNVLKGLFKLRSFLFDLNELSNIDVDIFKDTFNLDFIELSSNRMTESPRINNLSHLSFFNLRNNELTYITRDSFAGLPINSELFVSQHEVCVCYAPAGVNCSASDDRSPYLACDRLLSDRVLVAMMWLLGINALCGNVFVLVWRMRNTPKYKVQDILLSNLAMSDSLMGLYMVSIACSDLYYGDYFPMQSESWRTSIICRGAGALSIISSEGSVFFVTLISLDRFICIKFPYSTHKLSRKLTVVIGALIWLLSLALGVIPSILAGKWVDFKFYDNSHVCIGLPLALVETYNTQHNWTTIRAENSYLGYAKETFFTEFTGFENGLYYSIALFLGLNCICYVVILACYIEIVRAVMTSSKQSGRTRDMAEQIKLTTKVTAIVATDFLCWFPIIALGILVQTRLVSLPPSVYAWSVTFVLPLNSAINPYLYTIAEIVSNYRKKKSELIKPEKNSMQITEENSKTRSN